MALKRIGKEFRDIKNDSIGGVDFAGPVSESVSLLDWKAVIHGPADSPYAGGIFVLNIMMGAEYPFKPPKVTFATQIYHPSVNEKGEICLDILRDNWSPALHVRPLLLSILLLLQDPNPDDALNQHAAEQFKKDRAAYTLYATEMTRRYAQQ